MVRHVVKYLIIGAGPTGLGAAYTFKEAGENDFLVLEREDAAGGLAKSYVDDAGFTWDIGGHVHFSHYPEYSAMLERILPNTEWSSFARESWVWIKDRFVPYPLQHHLHFLPFRDGVQSLAGMLLEKKNINPENFYAWMQSQFGKPLTKLFMYPYNKKVWAHPPEEMSFRWVGERVMVPNKVTALKNFILRKKDPSWGPNASFLFPKRGGTGSIWSTLAAHIGEEKIMFGREIESIDTEKKEARTKNGDIFIFDSILSTIPIPLLSHMVVPPLPAAKLAAAETLKYSSTLIVGLGVRGEVPEQLKRKSWMYFPEDTTPFYRATVFSSYSESHTPDPKKYWSLMTETSSSVAQPREKKLLTEETVQGAVALGLILSAADIVSVWTYEAPYGYPIPSLGRDEALAVIIPALEERGIYSRGRFGGWKYEIGNQDHSFMQGAQWARQKIEKLEA